MTTTYTPAQVCSVVADATGFPLDPKMLRQWRSRGILRRREEEEGGWTRYSYKELFELCGLADAMATIGLPIGLAANVASVVRDYVPGAGGRIEAGDKDERGGYMLVFGSTIPKREMDEEGSTVRLLNLRALMHVTEAAKLFSPETATRFGGNSLVIVMVTELRKRFTAALALVDAS